MTALSVVMPVHNALPYLDESIASILAQTFADFEFVIRDDGSTDGSAEALRGWAARDRRIRLFHGPRLGPAESSNWVVRQSSGAIVARMDADDIARPDRLALQMAKLRDCPDTVMVGSLYATIDAAGRQLRPADLWRVARPSAFPPFPHASVMLRRSVFDAVGGYRAACDYWEDLDLFLRVAEAGRVAVIGEPLISYRLSAASTRLAAEEERLERAVDRMYRCVRLYERHEDYDHLLGSQRTPPARIDPRAYIARGSTRLWAGQPPAVLRRAVRGADLAFDKASFLCLVWSLWAALHPPSLRVAIRLLHRGLNRAARLSVVPGQPSIWQPRAAR